MLNIVLLITCIFVVILLLLYLFFWNRVLAIFVSVVLRIAFWNQAASSSICLDIGSVQFSVLAGRIAFKDLCYYSSNQTIRVVKGQISWRYWIRKPAEEDDLSHARVLGEDPKYTVHEPLSCRVHMSLQGFEWFIYNRTAAYESILAQIFDDVPPTPAPTPAAPSVSWDAKSALRKMFSRSSTAAEPGVDHSASLASLLYHKTPGYLKRWLSWVRLQLPNLDPKNLLPMGIEVTKGAIICGNASTPNLLVAEFSEAEGTFGMVQARSRYDLYKQLLNLKFQNTSAHYFPNDDLGTHMGEVGQRLREHIEQSDSGRIKLSALTYTAFHKLWTRLRLWTFGSAPHAHTQNFLQRFFGYPSVTVPHPPTSWGWWKGPKKTEDETPIGVDFSTLEYAIERKILEAPALELLYYADAVGVVPSEPSHPTFDPDNLDPFDIGNGDLPPEWGMDVVVKGGFLRYGPWADRQRAILQGCFFPPIYRDVESADRLKPGDMRSWTGLKVFIELRDGVTLHVPFREASKDWQWDGKSDVPDRPRKREAAFIHVKAGDSSTISYIMPVVASATGYHPLLEVHLDTLTVTSSLNDIRLLTAQSCRVRCQLPSPLKWNGERIWTFSILLRQTRLFLLRDHINMLADLGRDWSSGPPSDYFRFIPTRYVVEFDLHDYEVNMYVNDHNIIDKPLIKEDNAMLVLHGMRLSSVVKIPLVRFRPEATTVSFRMEAPDLSARLTLPRWNTYSLYPAPDRSNVGRIGFLALDGSFRYHADVRDYNVDQLKLDFAARDVVYKVFGWTVRHFMVLRDNYFGSFTHFCTLSEYLEKRRKGQPITDLIESQYRPGKSNSMEVEVGLHIDGGLIILPAGLPGFEQYSEVEAAHSRTEDIGSCLLLTCPILQVHLRTNDYFMDMSLNIDTISGSLQDHCLDESLLRRDVERDTSEGAIILDELDITANRLFGPRPQTATYICIWEIHVGSLKASLSAHEARLLSAIGSSLAVNFSDILNAPAKEFALSVDPDVTFLKVRFDSVTLLWLAADSALELTLPQGIRVDSNDLVGQSYSKVTSLRVPVGSLKALGLSKQHSRNWHDAACVTFDAYLDMYSNLPGWQEKARAQTMFVNEQDSLTGRGSCLYSSADGQSFENKLPSGRGTLDNDIYLPQLRVPFLPSRRRDKSIPTRQVVPNGTTARKVLSDFHPTVEFSESEGDDSVPEADRDARLAKSRLPGAMHSSEQNTDGDSLVTGDESDDEDLTDSVDWDSDDTDQLDDPTMGTEWPLVSNYRALVTHYQGRLLDRPAMWEPAPFITIQRCRIPMARSNESNGDNPSASNFDRFQATPCAYKDDHVGTILRLHCRRSIHVWVTPLVIRAVENMLTDFDDSQLTPELRFDAIMTDYIRYPTTGPNHSRQRTVIDIYVSRLIMGCALSMMDTNQAMSAAQTTTHPVANDSTNRASRVVLEFALDNSHLVGSTTGSLSGTMAKASFQQLSVCLIDVREGKIARKSRQASLTVLQFALRSSSAVVTKRGIDVSLGSTSAFLEHGAEEVAYLFVDAAFAHSGEVVDLCMRHSTSTSTVDRRVIYQVIKYTRQRTVVDPLSTIQPSYLVQKGQPDHLRQSGCFKFLVYLRNCLRHLEMPERRNVLEIPSSTDASTTLQDLAVLLEDQEFIQSIEDTSGLPRHPFLESVFPSPLSDEPKMKTDSITLPMTISLRLQTFSFVLKHGGENNHRKESAIFVGPVTILAHGRPVVLLPPAHSNPARSYGNLALPGQQGRELRHIAVSVSLDKVNIIALPQVVPIVQNLARLSNGSHEPRSRVTNAQSASSSKTIGKLLSGVYIDIAISTRAASISVATERLVVELSIARLCYAATCFLRSIVNAPDVTDSSYSMNHSLHIEETALRVYSRDHGRADIESPALASFMIRSSRLNVTVLQEPQQSPVVRVVAGVNSVGLTIPRSALNLYRSIDEWKTTYVSQTRNPMRQGPEQTRSMDFKHLQAKPLRFSVQMACASAGVTLQVARGTWFSWEVKTTVTELTSSQPEQSFGFGLQAGPHIIRLSTKAHPKTHGSLASHIHVELPIATLKGHYRDYSVHGLSSMEPFQLTVKPADWDTLLSVYQKSEQGFNDLTHLVQETRPSKIGPISESHDRNRLKLSGSFRMKGFRVGVEGHSSSVYLECDDISGSMENQRDLGWQIQLVDLSLSLASHSSTRSALDRGHRSAFVTIDFQVNTTRSDTSSGGQTIQIMATKVHAVMQPTSIGELGEFVDQLQAAVLVRQADRASELAQFKEKTKNIMKSFDVKMGEARVTEKSRFNQYVIDLTIKNIGVAFPLAASADLQMTRSGSKDNVPAVRAFLFSIGFLAFGTERGENGHASMKGFSFQFVPKFRQSVATDFGGDSHYTQNRLLYPEMTAKVRSERTSGKHSVRIAANVSGFILDLDSAIPHYVFSLIDVYREGRERMDQLATNITRSGDKVDTSKHTPPTSEGNRTDTLPTSNILLSLTFASGKVRMHPASSVSESQSARLSSDDHTNAHGLSMGPEIFDLPVVTVWGEYLAGAISRKTSGIRRAMEPSSLIFKSTVHSSQNTLRPTLLPFVTKIVSHVESRLRQSSRSTSLSSPTTAHHILHDPPTEKILEPVDPVSGLKISLCLRIDQSKLELTCQPDVNVIAGLHWDSGGFIINISPGFRRVSLTGNVGGLTIGLKHGFLSEDCVKLDARNLAFNVTFAKTELNTNTTISSVSVVVDTEFSGAVRFSRLQDVLCFKAVWLDRIPVFSGPVVTPVTPQPPTVNATARPSSSSQELTTAVLLRLRQINLDADLGQSISHVKLRIDNMLFRTRLSDDFSELTLAIAQFAILASGNISGHVTVPDFEFQTTRHAESKSGGRPGGRMLDLTMRSGLFNVDLDSEYQKLIQYRAEPVVVKTFDDWSMIADNVPPGQRHIEVAFTVSGTEVVIVMNVGTIPKLVSYADKFKATLDAQREGASKESQAFRIASSPKPDNPLSAVANAMLKSTRSRLKEETGVNYKIRQRMSLRLDNLRLIVFPRSMRDSELAQFIGRGVHARLDRVVEFTALPARRNLALSFSSITTSRISQLNHSLLAEEDAEDFKQWLSVLLKDAPEATIFGLPSMNIRMTSEEDIVDDERRKLGYDFSSKFVVQNGETNREDIYITLNMSLYSWLTSLRKAFAREMQQAQAAGEIRGGPAALTQQAASSRKRAVEAAVAAIRANRDFEEQAPATGRPQVGRVATVTTSPKKGVPSPPYPIPNSPTSPLRLSSPTPNNGFDTAAQLLPMPMIPNKPLSLCYEPRERHIERLKMRQLGEATPDVMHPFFMKKAGFSLEDSLPQYVHEYATMPTEEIMKALLNLYSKQLTANQKNEPVVLV